MGQGQILKLSWALLEKYNILIDVYMCIHFFMSILFRINSKIVSVFLQRFQVIFQCFQYLDL